MGTLRALTIGTLTYILAMMLMFQPNMQRALRDVVGHLMASQRRQHTLNDSVLVNGNAPPGPILVRCWRAQDWMNSWP